MTLRKVLLAAACLAILAMGTALAHPGRVRAADSAQDGVAPNCDRACLYAFLDQYLDALKMKDPSRLPLAKNFRYSENNVMMDIGDGVWGTVTGLGNYNSGRLILPMEKSASTESCMKPTPLPFSRCGSKWKMAKFPKPKL